ncbi:MAG: twin-arginine translocase subunit TatC [Micrococcaceae bacterium]
MTTAQTEAPKNISKSRRKNPEGRMPLKEHFRELKNRLLICAVALILASVAGWFLYPYALQAIQQPLINAAHDAHREASLNFAGIITAFDLQLQMSIFIGIIISSPIWIYEGWAFLAPGFTKKEKWYSVSFLLTSLPLFLLGVFVAWLVLPHMVMVLTNFIPMGGSNLIPARDYITFVSRLMLVFGLSFLMPVLVVGLNTLGVLPSRTLIKSWRIVFFLICLFAAFAAPGSDAMSMFFLAAPLILLFAGAIGITYFLDKRREKKKVKQDIDIEKEIAAPTPTEEIGR